jgi:hypothetical protein
MTLVEVGGPKVAAGVQAVEEVSKSRPPNLAGVDRKVAINVPSAASSVRSENVVDRIKFGEVPDSLTFEIA